MMPLPFKSLSAQLSRRYDRQALFDRIEALADSLDCWLDYSRLLGDCLDQIPNAFAAAPLFLRLAAVNEERLG